MCSSYLSVVFLNLRHHYFIQHSVLTSVSAFLRTFKDEQTAYYDDLDDNILAENVQKLKEAHGAIIKQLTQKAGKHGRAAAQDKRVADTLEARQEAKEHIEYAWFQRIREWLKARCEVIDFNQSVVRFLWRSFFFFMASCRTLQVKCCQSNLELTSQPA